MTCHKASESSLCAVGTDVILQVCQFMLDSKSIVEPSYSQNRLIVAIVVREVDVEDKSVLVAEAFAMSASY